MEREAGVRYRPWAFDLSRSWRTRSPGTLVIESEELHLWRVDTALLDPAVNRLARLLSADEVARAERYHRWVDRRRFLVRRAVLRAVLGRYLDLEPETIRFSTVCERCGGGHGRPVVAVPQRLDLDFSVSQSCDLALFGLRVRAKVGVDVEELTPGHAKAVDLVLSRRERCLVTRLPHQLQQKAYLGFWTRKEAFVKAVGEGLAARLGEIDVGGAPSAAGPGIGEAGGEALAVFSFRPCPGFVGAVATNRKLSRVSAFAYQES